MNPWQLSLQIRKILRDLTWPGGSAGNVFGTENVRMLSGTPVLDQLPMAWPCAFVGLQSAQMDADDPDFLEQTFRVFLGAYVAGDQLGAAAVAGGISSDVGLSANRGIEELGYIVRGALEDLTTVNGVPIILSATNSSGSFVLGNARQVAMSETTFLARCTSALFYSFPQKLAYNSGITTFTWEGSHCSSRFDFKQFRLVQKAGSVPSTDPTDGTVVATTTGESALVSGSSGNTYTVFADYNPRDTSGSVIGSSSPEVGAYLSL